MANEQKQPTLAELQAQIERLSKELAGERAARGAAEQMAEVMANASQFIGSSEERPTGKSIKVKKCINPWVKDEKAQEFIDVDLPTYFYAIQLPTGAGIALSTNGVEYYHGQTYEVDYETLIDLKSRVARCWDHEKSIHGDNENAYRKPTNKAYVSAAAAKRGAH